MNINTKTFTVMKFRNLAISALAATFAVVSCNKQDTAPMADSGLMAVEISLENLNFTKGPPPIWILAISSWYWSRPGPWHGRDIP